MFFSDKQKNKVEFYALVYVISFLLPFPASLYSVALSQLGGVALWLIGSITYMIVYLRVVSELPKEPGAAQQSKISSPSCGFR